MNKWISIYEEMPPLWQEVLLLTKDREAFVGHRYTDRKPRKTVWQSILTGFIVDHEEVHEDEMVTHWMPLPSFPPD